MENIIQHFCTESINKICECVAEVMAKHQDFSVVTAKVKEETDQLGKDLCNFIIDTVEQAIKNDPLRPKEWHVQRTDDDRSINTLLGAITYKRTYYKSAHGKGYCYLLDKVLGIEPYDKIDTGLKAASIELAADISYAKSGEQAGPVAISRQSVANNIRELQDIKVKKNTAPKKVLEILYIEADEDHASLQTGKKALPKLIYVHEGLDLTGLRHKTKNIHYFSSLTKSTEELWTDVYQYITDNYEVEKLKRVYIAGDGAKWIKAGLNWFRNARFVLDRYHLNKYVLKATGHAPQYRHKLWISLNRADKDAVKEILDNLIENVLTQADLKEVMDVRRYILNNWDGIQIYAYEDRTVIGCSAEGHVGHILSARISRVPLGWGIPNLENITCLRTFKANGGKVYDLLISQKEKQEPVRIEQNILRELRKKVEDKSHLLGVKLPVIEYGKVTPLYNILKELQGA